MGKKKEKFFLELDEEQGLWKFGKGEKPAQQEPEAAATPAVTPTTPLTAAEPISLVGFFDNRPAEASAAEEAAEPDGVVTFAATNPLPLAQPGRRGPGPSLDIFKAMAREVKRSNF